MPLEVINSLVLFLIGFYILIHGAHILIRGAVSIAKTFNVSNWFVGAVIVSAGTSIPELSINIASVFNGNDIGLGTVLGSNIFTITVVLGVGALFYPIAMRREWVRWDIPFIVAITGILSIFLFSNIFGDGGEFHTITRLEGVTLVALLFAWYWIVFHRKVEADEELDIEVITLFVSLVMFGAGVVGVFLGGRWVVDGASTLALLLGVQPAVVGLSIVALGTALPELVVSFVALVRRSASIAVGNVIGSQAFNILAVLGLTSLISPIEVTGIRYTDVGMVLGVGVLLLLFMYTGKRYTLGRFEGVIFLLVYITYIITLYSVGIF